MTLLRRIGTLDLPGVKPADISAAPLPMFEWIEVGDLWVNPLYQRDLSPAALRMIAHLVETWDWLKLIPLLVALTENGLEVIDGQTRALAAMLHPMITTLPCYVVDGSTLPERAGAFVSLARDRVAISRGQLHRAAVTAQDPAAVALDEVCRAAGVKLLASSPAFGAKYEVGDTLALSSIRTMLARRGAEKTAEILKALVAAELAPISAHHIRAAEALCCEPEFATDYGPEQLTVGLRSAGIGLANEVKALQAAKGIASWRALVAILFKRRGAKPRTAEVTALSSSRDVVPAPKPALPRTRIIDRRPVGPVHLGEPEPGRSALDERRRAQV